jgi:hypothetical protein
MGKFPFTVSNVSAIKATKAIVAEINNKLPGFLIVETTSKRLVSKAAYITYLKLLLILVSISFRNSV